MSVDIRDWTALREHVLGALDAAASGKQLSINEALSLRIQKVLVVQSFGQPTLAVTGFSSHLPFKFSEAVPPSPSADGVLPPLLVTISVDFALPEGFSVHSSACVDVPIPGFVECECWVDVKRMAFRGVVQFGIVDRVLLFGLESVDLFDIDLCTSIGMSSSRQIKPSQVDKFVMEKARQAVDLLLVHPLVVSTPAGVA